MHGKLLVRISAVTAYFVVNYFTAYFTAAAASELLPEQSLLDKALKKIVEKTY